MRKNILNLFYSQSKKVGSWFALENVPCRPQVFREIVSESWTSAIRRCLTVGFCSDFGCN